jgi:hypothetical protein
MLNCDTLGACIWVDGVDGDESEVGWARTWPGTVIVYDDDDDDIGGGCGFQFCPCGQHTRSKHPVEQNITHVLLPNAIQLLHLVIKHPSFLERVVCLVQFQCRARILDRFVCLRLDVLSEDEPGQKTERETPVAIT